MPNTILVAAITNGGQECTLGFCTTLLRLQIELGKTPDTHVTVEFFKTLDDALMAFRTLTRFDVLSVIETHMSCDPSFLTTPPPELMPFVVGIYPEPTIDWKRVKHEILSTHEPSREVGNVYNAKLPDGVHANDEYAGIDAAGLKIFKITRGVLEDIVARHGHEVITDDDMLALAIPGIVNGKLVGAHERVCFMWGKGVAADLRSKCSSFGPIAFTGCVGRRGQIR
jgi:hypothetical protein